METSSHVFANQLQLFSDLVSPSVSLSFSLHPLVRLLSQQTAMQTLRVSCPPFIKLQPHHSLPHKLQTLLPFSFPRLLQKSHHQSSQEKESESAKKKKKMVGVFGRSLSFPNKNHARPKTPMTHHTRSVSLPTRSHPLLSNLHDQLSDLDAWSSSSPPAHSSARLTDGLSNLRNAVDSLDDALHLPQAQNILRGCPQLAENLLEYFLRFADAYGIFQSSVLAFKEAQMAVEMAIRRKDESKIASYMKARKRMHKEMRDLSSNIRCVTKCDVLGEPDHSPVHDAELVAAISGVVKATASVSLALFDGLALSFAARKPSWSGRLKLLKKVKANKRIEEIQCAEERLWSLRKMKGEEVSEVLKKMGDLGGCIESIESGSERVFRSLISARVSLLNTLTL